MVMSNLLQFFLSSFEYNIFCCTWKGDCRSIIYHAVAGSRSNKYESGIVFQSSELFEDHVNHFYRHLRGPPQVALRVPILLPFAVG